MSQGALSILAQYSAPLRRFGALGLARFFVLAVGLIAMTALTLPELQGAAARWLSVCLWCCYAFFAAESVLRLRGGTALKHVFSPSGMVDLLGVLPVPIALLCGAEAETAWLFASLWVLKLGQDSPGFAQLGRVFVLEARPLASVLVLFLIVLFL